MKNFWYKFIIGGMTLIALVGAVIAIFNFSISTEDVIKTTLFLVIAFPGTIAFLWLIYMMLKYTVFAYFKKKFGKK